jgi:uncharacterized membrane protein
VRSQTARLSAVTINVWRSGTAGLLSVLGVLALQPSALREGVPLAAVAFLGLSVLVAPGLGDTLYFASLRLIGVARAMPLSGTNPLFTALMAVATLGEVVTPRLALGMALVFASIYLIAGGRLARVSPGDARRGAALALAASFLWACGTVLVRPAVEQIEPLVANAIRLPMTALIIAFYGWQTGGLTGRAELTRRSIATLLAVGAITAFSTIFFLSAVQHAGAARTATLTATAPIFGAPLAILIYREPLTARLVAGILVSVAGIVLVVGS